MTPRAQIEESDYMAQPEEPARLLPTKPQLSFATRGESDWGSAMSSPAEERKNQRPKGANVPPMRPLRRVAPAWGMATSTSPRSPTPRSPTPQVPASPSPAPQATSPSPLPLPVQQGGWNSGPASARAPAPKRSVLAQDSVTVGESMPPVQRPSSAMSGTRGSTTHWRPNEQSLLRNSFNSIVGQKKLDVTEVMMRDASMGRQAEMGPGWTPGGLVSRRMADALTART